MLRKSIITVSLISLANTCLGYGGYLGVGVGPENARFHQRARITQLANFNALDTENYAGKGVFGSVYGGYGYHFADYGWRGVSFYLGGEANANGDSNRSYQSNKEFIHKNFSHTTYKFDHSFGVAALPGLVVRNTLFYGRIGYAAGKFKVVTTDVSLKNVDKYLNGFRYGVGMEHVVSMAPPLSVRVEYSHASYESTRFTVFEASSFTRKSIRIKPSTSQVEFGLTYHFC